MKNTATIETVVIKEVKKTAKMIKLEKKEKAIIKAQTLAIEKAEKEAIEKAKKEVDATEGKKPKKESTYKTEVLKANKILKEAQKSLGGCRAVLILFSDKLGLSDEKLIVLKASKQKDNYKILESLVRTSKSGNYAPFYLLQTLDNEKSFKILQDKFTFES